VRALGRITPASDSVFNDNSADELAQQTLALTGDPQLGYAGTLTIPVDLTAERSAGGMMAPPDRGRQRSSPTSIGQPRRQGSARLW